MPNEPPQLDAPLRGKQVAQIIGRDLSTIWAWIKRGDFPLPIVLNPGQRWEIVGWRRSDIQQWIDTRPQRLAKPVTQRAYEARRAEALEKQQQRKIIRRPTA